VSDDSLFQPDGPEAQLSTSVTAHGPGQVLSVAGDLDMSTAQQLLLAVEDAVGGEPALLVVDLSGVQFMDSVGLAALVNAQRAGKPTRMRFVASAPVQRTLDLVGLNELLDTYPSVAEALAAG
jgi:anti-sigma B factor antagonist